MELDVAVDTSESENETDLLRAILSNLSRAGQAWATAQAERAAAIFAEQRAALCGRAGLDPPAERAASTPSASELRTHFEKLFTLNFHRRIAETLARAGMGHIVQFHDQHPFQDGKVLNDVFGLGGSGFSVDQLYPPPADRDATAADNQTNGPVPELKQQGEVIGSLPAHTVVHLRGIPFFTHSAVLIGAHPNSFSMAGLECEPDQRSAAEYPVLRDRR